MYEINQGKNLAEKRNKQLANKTAQKKQGSKGKILWGKQQ